MADQNITVTIPAGQTVVQAIGIIMTHEGRIVVENKTAPTYSSVTSDPKPVLMMLEQARNEINKTPNSSTPLRSANTLVRS